MSSQGSYLKGAIRQQHDIAHCITVLPSLKLVADELPVPADQACGSVTYPIKVATTDKSIVGRVDYHISDKHSLFVRYYYASFFCRRIRPTF